ncbi:MAG: hypothetical protein AB7U85_07365 [Alphaproteobacteria bacterium]
MPNRVQVIKETIESFNKKNDWRLCFQWCQYVYEDGGSEYGYRFIWRTPENKLQPARGQARLPSVETIQKLINTAKEEGWGEYTEKNPK